MEKHQLSQWENINTVANKKTHDLMHTCQPNCNGSGEKGDANPVETSVTPGCVQCSTARQRGFSPVHQQVINGDTTDF